MSASDRIDTLLDVLKWPTAFALALWLPGACRALYLLAKAIAAEPWALAPFAVGFVGYAVLWWTLLRRPMFGSFFSTLEHELTHALFALATGHRVVGLKATWKRGGRISFVGRGNWLITLAPYFFPTACIAVLLVGILAPDSLRVWIDAALGAAVGYHLVSTWRETHWGQTDLKREGYLFALMVLPTANAILLGVVLAFAHGGRRATFEFLRDSLSWPW